MHTCVYILSLQLSEGSNRSLYNALPVVSGDRQCNNTFYWVNISVRKQKLFPSSGDGQGVTYASPDACVL